MFFSTYGLVRSVKHEPVKSPFIFKAVNPVIDAEVFAIGSYYDECGFEPARIYVITIGNEFVPFFVKHKEIQHADIYLRDIDPRQVFLHRKVSVKVVSLIVSQIGVELEKRFPQRRDKETSISYIDMLSYGYSQKLLSSEEAGTVIGYLENALPKMRFDYFEDGKLPHPAICISVVQSGEEDSAKFDEDDAARRAKLAMEGIHSDTKYKDVIGDIERYTNLEKYRLETLLADVINVERDFFIKGWFGQRSYPQPITRNVDVWPYIREIYEADYYKLYRSFDEFLVKIVSVFQERGFLKTAYDKYSNWTPDWNPSFGKD